MKAENESLKTNLVETTTALKKALACAERSENTYKWVEQGFEEELKLVKEQVRNLREEVVDLEPRCREAEENVELRDRKMVEVAMRSTSFRPSLRPHLYFSQTRTPLALVALLLRRMWWATLLRNYSFSWMYDCSISLYVPIFIFVF